ncbi:hypothetical protein RJ640_027704 [Escallonia rubra]|uniref:NAC domain-containing protein n=1 Tax=Escallonia rubra TaxID=112253 RepID=A0AA88QZ91_9ASTE|nr:hypothetical protein RJ640_027704 [Escallonia rubra]
MSSQLSQSETPTMEGDQQQSQPQPTASVPPYDENPQQHEQPLSIIPRPPSGFDDYATSDEYLDSFPPGYRFCPFDEELVVHYLKKKVLNEVLPHNKIREVNLYHHNPEQLTEKYQGLGEKEWYFFTPRDRKYRNGTRPNRAAGNGYWKATGADKSVKSKGVLVGFRKALVFYQGKPPKGDKTSWIMHEYRVNEPPRARRSGGGNDMRLDDWVLCRIYKKADKGGNKPRPRGQEQEEDFEPDRLSAGESSPVVTNDNFPAQMNCDYVFHPGDSAGLLNNRFDDYHQQPLPVGFPEVPPQLDPNAACFNSGMRPLPFRPSPVSSDSMFRPNYLKEDPWSFKQDPWSFKQRGLQQDLWGTPNIDNFDFTSQIDFSNMSFPDPYSNLDILPSNPPPENLPIQCRDQIDRCK